MTTLPPTVLIIYICIYLSFLTSIYLSIRHRHLSIYLSIRHLSIYLFDIYLSIYWTSICLSIRHLSIYLFDIYLSIYSTSIYLSIRHLGNFLENNFWTPLRVCPSERFLDPPPHPINFVHDQISIHLALFRVRLG